MRSPLTAILFLAAAIALPAAITACSVGGEEDTSSGEEALKKGKEGAACNFTNKLCKAGLVCKMKQVGSGSSSSSGGPPPGAVGMPAPSDSTSSSTSSGSTSGGPPPGAVGMPQFTGTCQKPAAGELGGACGPFLPCDPGLTCDEGGSSSGSSGSTSGGPPPGAVGMPAPSNSTSSSTSSGSTSGGPPPGAVGMPAPVTGKCVASGGSSSGGSSSGSTGSTSGGPPPGAVGLPAPQSCPPSGAIIDCMPVTTNPNCASARRDWIEANCPDVSFLD